MDDIKCSAVNNEPLVYDPEKDYGTPKKTSDKQVTLTIDGAEVTVPEGTSIMHAAQLSGDHASC